MGFPSLTDIGSLSTAIRHLCMVSPSEQPVNKPKTCQAPVHDSVTCQDANDFGLHQLQISTSSLFNSNVILNWIRRLYWRSTSESSNSCPLGNEYLIKTLTRKILWSFLDAMDLLHNASLPRIYWLSSSSENYDNSCFSAFDQVFVAKRIALWSWPSVKAI